MKTFIVKSMMTLFLLLTTSFITLSQNDTKVACLPIGTFKILLSEAIMYDSSIVQLELKDRRIHNLQIQLEDYNKARLTHDSIKASYERQLSLYENEIEQIGIIHDEEKKEIKKRNKKFIFGAGILGFILGAIIIN